MTDKSGDASTGSKNSLSSVVADCVPLMRGCLSQSRKFFINIMSKFVAEFVPKFTRELFKSRANYAEAELKTVKQFLLKLPNFGLASEEEVPPPAAYVHTVNSGLKRAEIIVTMAREPLTDIHHFVRLYLDLSREICDAQDFLKILELQGINMWRRNRAMNVFKEIAAAAMKRRQISGDVDDAWIDLDDQSGAGLNPIEKDLNIQSVPKSRSVDTAASSTCWVEDLQRLMAFNSGDEVSRELLVAEKFVSLLKLRPVVKNE
jgi:hypothetical protein